MSTTKYELKRCDIEISYKNRMKIVEGFTQNQNNIDFEIIKSFDNKDDALLELQNYKTDIRELKGESGVYYLVEEYYVEESVYDEDGEWESGGDIWEFSEMTELEEV